MAGPGASRVPGLSYIRFGAACLPSAHRLAFFVALAVWWGAPRLKPVPRLGVPGPTVSRVPFLAARSCRSIPPTLPSERFLSSGGPTYWDKQVLELRLRGGRGTG